MTAPFRKNGLTYCTLPDGSRHCTGSMMGRREVAPHDPRRPIRLNLRRVRLNSGGYDGGGAYWGTGLPLFCAWGEPGHVEIYCRATDRKCAKDLVRVRVPGARFFR